MNEKIKKISLNVDNNDKKIESYDIYEMGYYLGSSDQWREKHVNDTNNIYNKAKENLPTLFKGNTFYRTAKLSLPREKMNVVNEKYGTKTIRDIKKANWIITSENYINSLIDQTWDTLISSDKLIALVKAHLGKNGMDTDQENSLIIDLEKEDCFFIINNGYYHNSSKKQPNYLDFFNRIEDLDKSRGYHTYCPIKCKTEWDYMLNNINDIILDVYLNKLATEDSVIVDTETYNSLCSMFKGNDTENYTLAMEIMANCNVEKSKGFLALLFFRFENKFKEAKAWNHVNFKTIKTRFEKYALQYSRSHVSPYNQFIEHLVEEKGLTIFVMEAVLDTVYNQVIKQSFGIDMNSVFELNRSNLKLKDEYAKKCIDKNIGEVLKEESKLVLTDKLPF